MMERIPSINAKPPINRASFLKTCKTFFGVFSEEEKAEIFSSKSFTVNLEPQ